MSFVDGGPKPDFHAQEVALPVRVTVEVGHAARYTSQENLL